MLAIGDKYEALVDEAFVLNALGIALVGLAILIPWIVRCPAFRKGLPREGRPSDGPDI